MNRAESIIRKLLAAILYIQDNRTSINNKISHWYFIQRACENLAELAESRIEELQYTKDNEIVS